MSTPEQRARVAAATTCCSELLAALCAEAARCLPVSECVAHERSGLAAPVGPCELLLHRALAEGRPVVGAGDAPDRAALAIPLGPLCGLVAVHGSAQGRFTDEHLRLAGVLASTGALALAAVTRSERAATPAAGEEARQELRDSEVRHRAMTDAIYDGIVLHDRGVILEANRAFAAIHGYADPSEMIGLSFASLLAPESVERVRRAVESGDRGPIELVGVRRDGSCFDCETWGRLVPYQGRTVIMSAGRDITARKQAEVELREREALFRAVAETAFDAIFVHADGVILEANRTCAALHGFADPGELRGRQMREFLTPESMAKLGALLSSAGRPPAELVGTLSPRPIELVGVRRDGSRFPLETCGQVATYRGRLAFVSAGRDVTARKQAEAELRRLAEDRRRLAAQVLSAQEEERRALSRELHDGLGQLLAVLKMEAQWLAEHAREPDEVLAEVVRIQRKADEMLGLVRGLARQLRPPVLDDLGVDCALESLVQDIRGRSGIEFHIALRTPRQLDPAVATAVYRIAQEALANLVRHGQADRCWLSCEDSGTHVALRVEHDGPEVERALLASGRSLGVASMRERTVILGGELSLEPREGGGTILLAHIPLPGAVSADERA